MTKRLAITCLMLLAGGVGRAQDAGSPPCISNRDWYWDPRQADCADIDGQPKHTGIRWFDSTTGECRPTCESGKTDRCIEMGASCTAQGLFRSQKECEDICMVAPARRPGC